MKRVAAKFGVEEDLTLRPTAKGLLGVDKPVEVVLLAAEVGEDGGDGKNWQDDVKQMHYLAGVGRLQY